MAVPSYRGSYNRATGSRQKDWRQKMVSLCFCHQFFCRLSVRLVGSLGLAMSAIQTWIRHHVPCFCVSPCCASLNKNEPLGTHSMPERASNSLLKYLKMPHAKDAKSAKSSEEMFLCDLRDLGVRLFQQSAKKTPSVGTQPSWLCGPRASSLQGRGTARLEARRPHRLGSPCSLAAAIF